MAVLAKVRKSQLSGQVVSHLMEWLSSGAVQIGDKLPTEPEIMKQMGVGRSTIREAIKILEHQGILEVRVGDGTYLATNPKVSESFISRLRRADKDEIGHLKLSFEMQIACLAAENRDETNIEAIAEALRKCQDAHDDDDAKAFADADYSFHKEIANAAKTDLLYDFYLGIRDVVRTLEYEMAKDSLVRKKALLLHLQLFNAIKSKDSSTARDLWLLK